jgi:hypothetical protein
MTGQILVRFGAGLMAADLILLASWLIWLIRRWQ